MIFRLFLISQFKSWLICSTGRKMGIRKIFSAFFIFFMLGVCLKAQVKPGGYFSFEYLKSQSQGYYPLGTFANFNGGLSLSGTVYGKLSFAAEGRMELQGFFKVAQAFLSFQGSRFVNLKFGLFEIPFGRYNWSARPQENPTVFRPLVFHFFPYRLHDLGICWQGDLSFFNFSAYLVNGLQADLAPGSEGYLRTGFVDNNKDKGIGSRLAIRFGQGAELGGSFYTGRYDPDGTKDVQFKGVDLIWVTPEWEVRGRSIQAAYDHPYLNQKINFDGYYLTVSMLFKNFRLYYSYQKSDLPDDVIDDEQAPPLNIFFDSMKKKTRSAVGLRLDLASVFFAKIEYDWNKEQNVKLKDNMLLVQLGFAF